MHVDGNLWFSGDLSCLLVGNVGTLFGGMTVFQDARPDDGRLDVGVVTATGVSAWLRALRAPRGRITATLALRPHDRRPPCRRPPRAIAPLRARRWCAPEAQEAEDQGATGCDPGGGAEPVSTATRVPETFELTGDDARETLRRVGPRRLLADAWMRLRVSDGFSHARSLAYTTALVLVQAIIGVIGLVTAFGNADAHGTIVRTLRAAVPGPAGEMLVTAVRQAHLAGTSGQYFGLIFGLVGSLVTGATLMGQTERALNRLYGVETDRPTFEKYRLALLLAVSAGLLGGLAFVLLTFGRDVGHTIDSTAVDTAWRVLRWPVALLLMTGAMALILRYSPRRHQPQWSWLAFASTISVLLWCAVTIGLGFFFDRSGSFGRTYGPLAGIVALLLWAFLSATALLFGAAIAAQLESVRAGEPEPQDEIKVSQSEPDRDEQPQPVPA